MNAFYVGQMVKKARGERAIGTVGVVAALGEVSDDPRDDMLVRVLHAWVSDSGWYHHGGTTAETVSAMWDPILPEGLESNEEIDALYEPEIAMEIGLVGMRVENLR